MVRVARAVPMNEQGLDQAFTAQLLRRSFDRHLEDMVALRSLGLFEHHEEANMAVTRKITKGATSRSSSRRTAAQSKRKGGMKRSGSGKRC